MNNFKIFLGIFATLAVSRFVPHPPNFTTLIALSFYVPILIGRKGIFIVFVSFVITDFLIEYHFITHWTWGSILLIGLASKFFSRAIQVRYLGLVLSTLVFFLLSNFGVWSLGSYGYTFAGLINCFILAIPFYGNTLISSLFFGTCIEVILILYYRYTKIKILKL